MFLCGYDSLNLYEKNMDLPVKNEYLDDTERLDMEI